MGMGYILGGIRSALIVGAFLLFIALTEWWDRALITAYLTSIAVVIAASLGFGSDASRAAADINWPDWQ